MRSVSDRTFPGSGALLIGGSSSVGKTVVACTLSERLGVAHVEADCWVRRDPRLDPLAGPIELWDQPPQRLCDLLIHAAELAMPFVEDEVADCAGVVIESERIHPDVIKRLEDAGRARGVLIIEPDAERLHATLMAIACTEGGW
jgi:hypothetical protein